VRFRIADANNAWEWFSSQAVTFQWPGAIPEPKVERGFYEEWTFPRAGSGSAKNVALLTDFQPAGAKWCWSEEICDDRREEVALAISPINNKELWKDNHDLSFTVTIRMPRSFGFGEVSGSAQNVLVRYGKNLPAYNGVETREVIATLTPIPTARGGTPTQVSHQAETITYDANIWIYGQKNSIVDQLGECGRIGGVQVVSNAMHSLDPTWNAATESIDVRLSTPHLKPDGSINTGYLEVRVPEQAAACMWKINLDGSIRAVVDITYEDGSKPSVATVVGNKIGSDYLIISSGFHYSSPTLKVKLAQSATTFAADKKKTTTITCIKGAQKRVIKGINPNCPKGFVRKSA
jgi:hypothetical protein